MPARRAFSKSPGFTIQGSDSISSGGRSSLRASSTAAGRRRIQYARVNIYTLHPGVADPIKFQTREFSRSPSRSAPIFPPASSVPRGGTSGADTPVCRREIMSRKLNRLARRESIPERIRRSDASSIKCETIYMYYCYLSFFFPFEEVLSLSGLEIPNIFDGLSVRPLSQPRSLQLVAEFPRRDRRDASLQSLRGNSVVSCAKARHS